MLRSLHLTNFRGFSDHSVDFKDISVIVGMNNAGKSTIVDALRILSITTQRFRSLQFLDPPGWTGLDRGELGISPSLQNIHINFHTIFNHYGDPPGLVAAEFTNGTRLKIFIGPEQIFALIYSPTGRLVVNRWLARDTDIPGIAILPQIGPVQEIEQILSPETVRRNIFSSRFSAQFRNQIYYNRDCYRAFTALVESTWSKVQVADFRDIRNGIQRELYLDVRNDDFTGELFVMGHGLQMWMQTMWFISRFPGQSTLILDEPDVYMHPDLQRKMCKFLFGGRRKYPQVIVTTHSVEIMAEVDAGQILILDRKQNRSIYADNLPSPQIVLDNIGSVHNVYLARLNWSRRFLVVEGGDLRILGVLHRILFPDSDLSLDAVPQMRTGGWGGWGIAVGAQQSISNSSGGTVKCYVIFDSDYHTEQEVQERYEQATKYNMNLHIWRQKEIENYLVNADTICRLIRKRIAQRQRDELAVEQVADRLKKIITEMKDEVQDQIASENHKKLRLDVSTANRLARERIATAVKSRDGLASLVSGKKVISTISAWTNENFNVSFNALAIAKEMYVNDMPDEMKVLLTAIEYGNKINMTTVNVI